MSRGNERNPIFKLGAVYYDVKNEKKAVQFWEKFLECSQNSANHSKAHSLLERVAKGEKEILSKREWLDNFRWEEEGWNAVKQMSIFIAGCFVEFILLLIGFIAHSS